MRATVDLCPTPCTPIALVRRGLGDTFRFLHSTRGGQGLFFGSRHRKLSFRGGHHGHDMDHSGAPEKQANSAVSRKSDGKAMSVVG
jgi:hypothetical protein